MNADLEHLVVLQAQDLELARLRAEMAEAPLRVKAAQVSLAGAEGALAVSRTRLAVEGKLRREQESEAASQRVKLERLRRSLDGATSSQQVVAFEHEIGFAQAAIARLEDEEFASMERTEALEGEQGIGQSQVEAAQGRLDSEVRRAAEVKATNDAAITGIGGERVALRAEISEQWLSTYDRLAKARGTAIAEAIGNATAGKCAACQMGVRPQRWQDLIGRDYEQEIFVCESCGRLLFWDPRQDMPRSWTAGERLNAAQGVKAAAGGSR